ncbi:hypothetical protein K523DRAFT_285322 [Schizophyllum commune Tattone D]|nr:hypothetical protein K525DRAFT_257152 [Schizophyllum commune Loenen D]KAI5824259.1 hypothetical protein K523DRAFT_285322 [Schizophyllum commune Tattone D]
MSRAAHAAQPMYAGGPPRQPQAQHQQQQQRRNFQVMPQTASAPPQPTSRAADPFYGHETVARLSARFIHHLFQCPELPTVTADPSQPSNATNAARNPQAKLPQFIAYALHRTKLHQSVTFAALVLLQRLKARFPTARGSSGHRLFISAFMIASKVMCDDTYSNKSWSVVAQGLFNLREINQMEREMCGYLDWELVVDGEILQWFEERVRKDFGQHQESYPNYRLMEVSRRARKFAASTSSTPVPEPNHSQSPIALGNRHGTPTKPPPTSTTPRSRGNSASHASSPATPETPSPSFSHSTSPASSASPPTPDGGQLYVNVAGSPSLSLAKAADRAIAREKMFAMAMPAAW